MGFSKINIQLKPTYLVLYKMKLFYAMLHFKSKAEGVDVCFIQFIKFLAVSFNL